VLSTNYVGKVEQLRTLEERKRFRKRMNSYSFKVEAMYGDGRTSESGIASIIVFGIMELEAFG
jgi:hypothetical protein